MITVSLQEILTQAFAFLLLLWLLKKFAWKPLLATLDERREKIKSTFDEIERAKLEVETLKKQHSEAVARIEEEARIKLQEAVNQGKQVSKEIQEEARKNAREILDKAKEDIALELSKSRVMLRNEVANLTLQATGKILKEKLTSEKDKELVLDFIEDLEKQI